MTGLILGALTHGTHAMGSLFTAGADPMALLWWTWVLQILAIAFILLAYRVGLIYGGADAKALLWITLLLPGWRALPGNASCDLTCGLHLPPSLGLLLWTGLAFLMMPIGLTLLNLTRGAIRGTEDLRLAWHAVRRPIARASEGHVWVLTELMDHPDGTIIPTIGPVRSRGRMRPPSTTSPPSKLPGSQRSGSRTSTHCSCSCSLLSRSTSSLVTRWPCSSDSSSDEIDHSCSKPPMR